MFASQLLSIACLFPLAYGLVITQPNSTTPRFDLRSSWSIVWTVDNATDNSPIDIGLYTNAADASEILAKDIPRNASEYTVKMNQVAISTDLTQFKVTINTPGDQGNFFLAESEPFVVFADLSGSVSGITSTTASAVSSTETGTSATTISDTSVTGTTDGGASATVTGDSAATSSNTGAVLCMNAPGAAGWTLAGTIFAMLSAVA